MKGDFLVICACVARARCWVAVAQGSLGAPKIILTAVGCEVSTSALCTFVFASDALRIVFYGVIGCGAAPVGSVRGTGGPLYQLFVDRWSRRYVGESVNDRGCALGVWAKSTV